DSKGLFEFVECFFLLEVVVREGTYRTLLAKVGQSSKPAAVWLVMTMCLRFSAFPLSFRYYDFFRIQSAESCQQSIRLTGRGQNEIARSKIQPCSGKTIFRKTNR